MQVLLRKNVERLGAVGAVVDVKPGYARNYLLPQGIAVSVTPANMRRVEIEQMRAEKQRQIEEQEMTGLAERLSSASITLSAKANEEGHLFGSITAGQIAEMLVSEGYKIEEKMIQLTEPIKELGVIEVPIQLNPDIVSSCKVWIVAE